ncbi:MAG TPA: hypothetical protein VFH36_09580 [Acidimicrobiales bacterium]|jgi:hypothetical protein|nr:hypothetical protein [Acidimicrobiales bacterium]
MPDTTVPTPQPPGDPRLTTLLTRCRSLRRELDRLDDALSMLTRDERAGLEASAVMMRDLLDGLEVDIDKRASGL